MAINSLDLCCDKPFTKSLCSATSTNKGAGNVPSCRLVKINFGTEGSICSVASSSRRGRKKRSGSRSPYLDEGSTNIHLSSLTEKTFIQKKGSEFLSSFPLAVNIYKANSDEFKSLKKANKKAKKSVLTLPNDQAPIPQTCTVSDMNDSEYLYQDEDRKKLKKRNPVPRNKKFRSKGRDYEFYDRDAKYCSQMNLDCSSTDILHNEKRNGKPKSDFGSKETEEKHNPHDVWAVLRNINRFQFRPSPPMSEESFMTPKRKSPKRRNRKDMRVVETCRTEEFAYISSYEVDRTSPHSISRSSSFDRVTVIDKQDDFGKICKELQKMVNSKRNIRGACNKPRIQNTNRITSKPTTKGTTKITNIKPLPIEHNTKKQINNCGDSLHTNQNKLHGNRDSPTFVENVKYEFSNPLYDKDTNHNLTCDQEIEQVVLNDFIYSGNSGSSKAACNCGISNKGGCAGKTKDKQHLSTHELTQQLNGITKVVLCKGQNMVPPKKTELPKRKRPAPILPSHPNHATDQPKQTNNIIMPKITKTDIKRRIAKLKFPIVVLGKDQLSSTFEVVNLDLEPSQFDGLDKHVWPFMLDWQDNGVKKQENALKTKNIDNIQKNKYRAGIKNSTMIDSMEFNKTQKLNRGLIPSKQLNTLKSTNDAKNTKSKLEQKRAIPPSELVDQAQQKKPKAIRQFKEKMLKLLYKNSPVQNDVASNDINKSITSAKDNKAANKIINKVDDATDTRLKIHSKECPRKPINSPVKSNKQASPAKQPSAKARWASDFIDNVIHKIKCGVYYTHGSKLTNQNQNDGTKEVEIQTIATNTEEDPEIQSISRITIKKKTEPFIPLPGFDNTQPLLEIKTMNSNEIAVKHCVTNIIVHFDVTVPNEPVLNIRKSCSLIPLHVTESQSKIFKCKTSIINAMLPAELCSILPKMMWNITQSSSTLAMPLVPIDKNSSHLSTISEGTRCESLEPFRNPLYLHVQMSAELQILMNGFYRNKILSNHKDKQKFQVKFEELHLSVELLPRLTRNHLFDCIADPEGTLNNGNRIRSVKSAKETISENPDNTCMALQRYPTKDRRLLPAFNRFDLASFLQKMCNYMTDNIPCSRVFNFIFDKNNTINLTTANSQGLQNSISINISKLMMNTTLSKAESITNTKVPAIKCFEEKDLQNKAPVNKTKKKSYVKLYRKCKSTSNISAERSSTSLSKITNLDEFFVALGSTKLFSAVFDNLYGHKILSSLNQMKTWISDINPTQALLVLLLVNKKDTPNLLRFRPVLLQGIAVSRITRANELDMEIEVIERENLNRLSQYEGITYSPATVESQDILFEELCWIAKTTASDYKLPFEESSENLLMSLLEKRKKLNPSYLRVMARYVGLGLLKTPIKK